MSIEAKALGRKVRRNKEIVNKSNPHDVSQEKEFSDQMEGSQCRIYHKQQKTSSWKGIHRRGINHLVCDGLLVKEFLVGVQTLEWPWATQWTLDMCLTLSCRHTCVPPICSAVILLHGLMGWKQVLGPVFDRPASCACCRGLWDHGMWSSHCRSVTGTVLPEVSEESHWNVQPLAATSISSFYCPLSRTFSHWTQAPRISHGSSIFLL